MEKLSVKTLLKQLGKANSENLSIPKKFYDEIFIAFNAAISNELKRGAMVDPISLAVQEVKPSIGDMVKVLSRLKCYHNQEVRNIMFEVKLRNFFAGFIFAEMFHEIKAEDSFCK